jgi:hypothetical protein
MKRVVAVLAVVALGPTADANGPVRSGPLVAWAASGAVQQVVYVAREDHPDSVALLAAASAAANVDITVAPFAGRDSPLFAVLVTSTLADRRATTSVGTEYLVRLRRDGGLEIACTFPAQASTVTARCGPGSHRTVAIESRATADELRRGAFQFEVTSRTFGDFTEVASSGCEARAPLGYEPIVSRYELAPDGVCSLVP